VLVLLDFLWAGFWKRTSRQKCHVDWLWNPCQRMDLSCFLLVVHRLCKYSHSARPVLKMRAEIIDIKINWTTIKIDSWLKIWKRGLGSYNVHTGRQLRNSMLIIIYLLHSRNVWGNYLSLVLMCLLLLLLLLLLLFASARHLLPHSALGHWKWSVPLQRR
jgi:hypothetical protein